MNKQIKLLIAAATVAIASQQAQAITVGDTNPADVYLNHFNPSYTGTFTLPAPFTDAGWDVVSAYAQFDFTDYIGGSETFNITFDGGEAQNGGPVPGSLLNLMTLTINFSPVGTISLAELQDGILQYTVTRTAGEFWLTEARLTAEIQPVTQAVPDAGATGMLLGLGVLGTAAVRRKLC